MPSLPDPPSSSGRCTVLAEVGARGVDTASPISSSAATALAAYGIDFVVRYLGSLTPSERDGIEAAGLAWMAVTYGNRFDGPAAASELRALGYPEGATVWLDVEGQTPADPTALITKINAWADAIAAAGFKPGLYVGPGPGMPLSSDELYKLHVVRYWRAGAMLTDRHGALQEPFCGYCMLQLRPEGPWRQSGVFVDVDAVQEDYKGRRPHWVVRA